jgi:hypothetical protein
VYLHDLGDLVIKMMMIKVIAIFLDSKFCLKCDLVIKMMIIEC